MDWVRVRILGTGQVEDFPPYVAASLVTSGRGEYVKDKEPEKKVMPVIEAAAIKPEQQTAVMGLPRFWRGRG